MSDSHIHLSRKISYWFLNLIFFFSLHVMKCASGQEYFYIFVCITCVHNMWKMLIKIFISWKKFSKNATAEWSALLLKLACEKISWMYKISDQKRNSPTFWFGILVQNSYIDFDVFETTPYLKRRRTIKRENIQICTFVLKF